MSFQCIGLLVVGEMTKSILKMCYITLLFYTAHPIAVLNENRDILYSRFIGRTLRQGNYLFSLPMKCRYFLYEFQEILMEYKIVIYEFEVEFES